MLKRSIGLLMVAVVVAQTLNANANFKALISAQETEEDRAKHNSFLSSLDHPNNPFRANKNIQPATGALVQCGEGLCCSKRTHLFFEYGRICGQPTSECQVGICTGQSAECYTIPVRDGAKCKDGQCYQGDCVSFCVGECCDGKMPLVDGTECDNGKCVNGVCVRKCVGECCETGMAFAKPDGAPCSTGECKSGKCTNPNVSTAPSAAKVDPLNGKKAIAVIIDEKPKTSEAEQKWNKLVADEHKEKTEEKAKEEARKQAEHNAKLAAVKTATEKEQKALLQAQNDNKREEKYWLYGLIGGAGFVGLLIIILAIVGIVKFVGGKKEKEKIDKESQDSYNAF